MASSASPHKFKSSPQPPNTRADVVKDSNTVKHGWASELKDRINLFPGQPDAFIDTLLPCSTPFPDDADHSDLKDAFKDYNPGAGKELAEYPNLLAGLRKVVEPLEEGRKLVIADTHGKEMTFPFNAFKDHHHPTYPDITVSFPGEPLVPGSWRHISMVMEVKPTELEDPFPKSGGKYVRTVEQLAKSARNLLLVHGLLHVYLVGIYGTTVRLTRFDHSCALVSVQFSLDHGGAKILRKFFWNFTHPIIGDTVVGVDPTVMPLDKESQDWVKSELSGTKPRNWEHHVAALEEGRRVEVYDEKTGRCVPYLLYHLIDVNGRLFSRATMVWRAIEDTRVWENGRLVPDKTCTAPAKPRILKEAWRQVVRTAETEVYKRLQERIPEEERFGLAKMECGGDIGALEMEWWERTQNGTLHATSETTESSYLDGSHDAIRTAAHAMLFRSTGSNGPDAIPFVNPSSRYLPDRPYPLLHPQHQTYSWRLCGSEFWHRERSHMRLVIDDVGRPLTEFTSTRELVMAMRDAIKGHQQAKEVAGVLHRDISLGNILIVDDISKSAYTGFVHDLDYSSMDDAENSGSGCCEGTADGSAVVSTGVDATKLKERTGTFYYMAVDLLNVQPDTIHDTPFDLESFYWVFCWVVLRHTICRSNATGEDGPQLCRNLFISDNVHTARSTKRDWFFGAAVHVEVPGNVPLTKLWLKFTDLASGSHLPIRFQHLRTALTYREVLDAFDEVLQMDGWPEDDWVHCPLLDANPKTGIAPVVPILADVPRDSAQPAPTGPRQLRSHTIQARLATAPRSAPATAPTPHIPVPSSSAAPRAGPVTRSASKRMYDAMTEPSPLDQPKRPSKRSKAASCGIGDAGPSRSSKGPPA
ncbi:hypothetical protein ONZ51_g3606 [Trametes cubensis]|uniref:Fungal-type protein kinase domain-containing protein n=1 Tax=Trametes cubensis TaxID=1111947 RepID=A0AAD7TXC3_9APHY|nr:hypothetical protein ONZ51_g3606 [Trametes cubensis]